jgi:hypothetical protein
MMDRFVHGVAVTAFTKFPRTSTTMSLGGKREGSWENCCEWTPTKQAGVKRAQNNITNIYSKVRGISKIIKESLGTWVGLEGVKRRWGILGL